MSSKISALSPGTPVAADVFPFVKVADHSTSPAGAGGSDQIVTAAALAQAMAALAGLVVMLSPSGGDDTAAIQAALLSFGTLGGAAQGQGGVVYLNAGQWSTNKPLIIPSAVKLMGGGWGSQITLATGSNCDVIQAATYQSSAQATILGVSATAIANAFWAGVENLAIHGDSFHTTIAGYHHGINVTMSPATSAAPSDPDFDPFFTVRNVRIQACTGDGINHTGRAGALFERVWTAYNNGIGIVPSFDTTLLNCLSEGNSTGGYFNHGSNTGAGCKFYNNIDNTWVSGTSYQAGQVAVSAGVMYFCILAVSGATAPASDPTHWTALTAATAPQATGYDWYFDTGAGGHNWAGVESQEPSKGGFYFKGPNAGAITLVGQCEQVNFNNGEPAYNSANPNHYAAVTLDGVSGVNVTLNSSSQSSGNGVIVTSLNSPGSNTLVITTDGTEAAAFNGGTPAGFTLMNGVAHQGKGTDTSGTATASAPTLASGTAAQLSTTQDVMLYIDVKVATNLTLAIGPTSSTATTLFASATAGIGVIPVRVPAGWWVKATSSGTFSNFGFTMVTC